MSIMTTSTEILPFKFLAGYFPIVKFTVSHFLLISQLTAVLFRSVITLSRSFVLTGKYKNVHRNIGREKTLHVQKISFTRTGNGASYP